jgi:hypothetical protein
VADLGAEVPAGLRIDHDVDDVVSQRPIGIGASIYRIV